MSRAVKLRSSIEYKTMLLEGDPQFENFYKEELIDFCKIAKKIILDQKKENDQLKEQLQQRDSIIEETINKIETLRMEKWSITGLDIMDLLDILNKYKTEDSEDKENI